MAETPLAQLIMKNAVFAASTGTSGTLTEFSDHADNVMLSTTNTSATFAAISGKSQGSVGEPVETLVMNIAQSLKAGSLWMFLRTNHGKPGKIALTPTGGGTGKVTADVVFQAPASLGGAQGGAVSAATLLVTGLATIIPET